MVPLRSLLWLLVAACVVVYVQAKPRRGSKAGLIVKIQKKDLQNLLGVKSHRKVKPPSCGVLLQLVHPIQSNDFDEQKRISENNNVLSKALNDVAKALGGKGAELVAVRKMSYQSNKLFFSVESSGIDEAEYADIQVAFYWKDSKVKKLIRAEAVPDASSIGVARFLNKVCGTGITAVGGAEVTAELPIDMNDL